MSEGPTIEQRLTALEEAFRKLVQEMLPGIQRGIETTYPDIPQKAAAVVEQVIERKLGAVLTAIEQRSAVHTRLFGGLCKELIEKGRLEVADVLALLEREKFTQAEITALMRQWRLETGGEGEPQ